MKSVISRECKNGFKYVKDRRALGLIFSDESVFMLPTNLNEVNVSRQIEILAEVSKYFAF